jgi:hypothetical protein
MNKIFIPSCSVLINDHPAITYGFGTVFHIEAVARGVYQPFGISQYFKCGVEAVH